MEGLNTRNIEVILIVAVVALLGAYSLCLAATTDKTETDPYILQPEAKEELIAFVNEARDFVVEQGKDKALGVFNDPKGEFVRGELYIIAYDFKGTRLAQPYMPEAIGENALNVTDLNGVTIVRNMLNVARRGNGTLYYVWANPIHNNKLETKLSYVEKVDDTWFLGAGTYLPNTSVNFSQSSRNDLISFVDSAVKYAQESGKDKALKEFNNTNGTFFKGSLYVFGDDFKGNHLVGVPNLIGTNIIDMKDRNGVEFVRDMIDLAKEGKGLTYYIYADPTKNMTESLKLSYVKKVDDTWWLGAGIYAPLDD
jgi:polar amino acid transport system substrate-binding protein